MCIMLNLIEREKAISERASTALEDPHAREVLGLLAVAGSVKNKRHLNALVFAAQEFSVVKPHYDFGFSQVERLAPLSAELSYDIHVMELIGAVVEEKEEHSLKLSGEYRRRIEADESKAVLRLSSLQELLDLDQEELIRFAKYTALFKVAEGKSEQEINTIATDILMLAPDVLSKFEKTRFELKSASFAASEDG